MNPELYLDTCMQSPQACFARGTITPGSSRCDNNHSKYHHTRSCNTLCTGVVIPTLRLNGCLLLISAMLLIRCKSSGNLKDNLVLMLSLLSLISLRDRFPCIPLGVQLYLIAASISISYISKRSATACSCSTLLRELCLLCTLCVLSCTFFGTWELLLSSQCLLGTADFPWGEICHTTLTLMYHLSY
jgi:hypothetical protein